MWTSSIPCSLFNAVGQVTQILSERQRSLPCGLASTVSFVIDEPCAAEVTTSAAHCTECNDGIIALVTEQKAARIAELLLRRRIPLLVEVSHESRQMYQ